MKGRTVSSFFGEKMGIVKYEPKYKQQVQNVCISQSTSRYKDDNAKKATLALYCDPYIDKEICLILKNDLDEVCGYILCAKDLKAYEKNAYPYYLTLKELDEVKTERFSNANRELERFYPEYPAHIHIDILEEYTGNGVGSKLMNALFEVLKEEKVPGICVLVDTNNKRAVRFYEKMGFKAVEENPGIMLCKLS